MVEQVKWVDEIITGGAGAGRGGGGGSHRGSGGGGSSMSRKQQCPGAPPPAPPPLHPPNPSHPPPPPPRRRAVRPEPRVHRRAVHEAQDRLHHPRRRPLPAARRHRRVRARQEAGPLQAGALESGGGGLGGGAPPESSPCPPCHALLVPRLHVFTQLSHSRPHAPPRSSAPRASAQPTSWAACSRARGRRASGSTRNRCGPPERARGPPLCMPWGCGGPARAAAAPGLPPTRRRCLPPSAKRQGHPLTEAFAEPHRADDSDDEQPAAAEEEAGSEGEEQDTRGRSPAGVSLKGRRVPQRSTSKGHTREPGEGRKGRRRDGSAGSDAPLNHARPHPAACSLHTPMPPPPHARPLHACPPPRRVPLHAHVAAAGAVQRGQDGARRWAGGVYRRSL
jgi:hypothetical protein